MKKRGTNIFVHRKAQVTIFIILGIVLLLSIGAFLYIRNTEAEQDIPSVPVIKEIPSQLAPIRSFTQECANQAGKEAVKIAGTQGGYVYPENFGMKITSEPTESDGVRFSPDSGMEVPYWWYLRASNDCKKNCLFSSQRPELRKTGGSDNSIESQIERYIKENMDRCLNNFESFKSKGYSIEEKGEIKPTVIITERNIDIFLEYPLKISIGDFSEELSQYYTSLGVDLKRVYELSTDITNAEIKYGFLETQALNLITHFSALDKSQLPPKTESAFNYGSGITWAVPAVKKKLESMLMAYIPGMQVPFTQGYERVSSPGNPLQEAIYAMEVPVNLDKRYRDLSADFDYLGWWPLYFKAGQEGIIKPESANALFMAFGVQRYSTNYDLSFPVVVTVSDPQAFGGEGYDFMFALESNIRNNQRIDEEFDGLEGVHTFEPTLFCNKNQWNSGKIDIIAIDKRSEKPLEDAEIRFNCGEEGCAIGSTDENGTLEKSLPICHNGIMTLASHDYFSIPELLTTNLEKESSIAIEAFPYHEKEIDVEKYIYSGNRLSFNASSLDRNEKAIISLKKIKESPLESDVMAVAEIGGQKSTARLVPGKYKASITLVKKEPLTIPAEKRKTGAGILGIAAGADDEFEMPELSFDDSYITGGAELDNNTGYITISPSQLYSEDKLVLKAIGFTKPEKVEDIARIADLGSYSSRFRQKLEPAYR